MELFCQYLFDCKGNASEAYRMAYNCANMTDEAINVAASRLKKNAKVTLRISEIAKEREKATEADRKRVQAVLMDIIMTDINDLYYISPVNGNVRTRRPSQLPARAKRSLSRAKILKDGMDYVFQDKVSAARTLGKWNGWEAPIKNEHTVTGESRVTFGKQFTPEDFEGEDEE